MPALAPLEKISVRAEIRQRFKSLGLTHCQQHSLRLAEHVLEFPAWKQASAVCLFASLPTEPDTLPLLKQSWSCGKRVALPRIQDKDLTLSLHWVTSVADLKRGSLGFMEPNPRAEIAPLADVELILVPGIAYDRQGGRLGRGGGYYDRLLARPECRAVSLGAFFSMQEVPRVPREPWDHPLQWIVNEEECFRATPAEGIGSIAGKKK